MNLRKSSALLFFIFLFATGLSVHAQVLDLLKKELKEKGKRELNRFVKKETQAVKDTLRSRIIQWSEDYDPAELNYAISFSDQSGMYEAEDKFETYKRSIIGFAAKPGSVRDKFADRAAGINPEDFNRSGELLYATNHFVSAEKAFMGALFLINQSGKQNSKQDAMVRSNLGLLYQTTGRYALSEEYTLSALEIRKKLNDTAALGASYNNLAVLKKEEGNFDEADRYLQNARELTLSSLSNKSTAYAIVLNNIASLMQSLGDYERAEKLQLQALDVSAEKLREKSPNYVRMQVNLAMIYQLQGKTQKAEDIYLEAMKLKRRRLGTKHPDYAVMLRNLAGLYLENGKTEPVPDLLEQAINIYRDKFGPRHPAYASALVDLAKYYMVQENPDQASPLLDEALAIQEETLGAHHPQLTETREIKAIWFWMKHKNKEALASYPPVLDEYLQQINRYFPALSESGQAAFWHKVHPRFLRFYAFASENKDLAPEVPALIYRYHVATKALLLNTSVKTRQQILSGGDPELINKYRQWSDLRRYLGKIYGMTNEQINEEKVNVDSLENRATQLEKELSSMSASFGEQFIDVNTTASDIASLLGPNEAAVEMIRFPGYRYLTEDSIVNYAALVVTREKQIPSLILFNHGNDLESGKLKAYRNAMQWAMNEAPFLEDFWNGLAEATAGKPVVYFSADGIYHFINLNTLQGQNGHFLIDSKDIRYLTNTRELKKLKKTEIKSFSRKNNTAFLLGAPKYDLGFDWDKMKEMPVPELPGTLEEVRLIHQELQNKGWQVVLRTGEDATEEIVKQIHHPSLVHLATHGYFLKNIRSSSERIFGIEPRAAEKNPLLRSGLLLAGADNTIQNLDTVGNRKRDDGILNAYEAMMLDLSGTQLVTLSACETGLGEIKNGEGVYGLLRAFQIAGSQSVMISLWQVSDEVTQKLMSLFYQYWLENNDEQDALTRAQREIKKTYKAPFYWGAFILVK